MDKDGVTDRRTQTARLVLSVAVVVLWASPALAGLGGGGAALGLGGALGGGSVLETLRAKIADNIATLAGIGILGLGAVLAFAKNSFMELFGGVASIATMLIVVAWFSGNTGMFFGNGALVP